MKVSLYWLLEDFLLTFISLDFCISRYLDRDLRRIETWGKKGQPQVLQKLKQQHLHLIHGQTSIMLSILIWLKYIRRDGVSSATCEGSSTNMSRHSIHFTITLTLPCVYLLQSHYSLTHLFLFLWSTCGIRYTVMILTEFNNN